MAPWNGPNKVKVVPICHPYSICKRGVPEVIASFGSQFAGDVKLLLTTFYYLHIFLRTQPASYDVQGGTKNRAVFEN